MKNFIRQQNELNNKKSEKWTHRLDMFDSLGNSKSTDYYSFLKKNSKPTIEYLPMRTESNVATDFGIEGKKEVKIFVV